MMKKYVTLSLVFALSVMFPVLEGCSTPAEERSMKKLELPVDKGVSAPFAGFIHHELMVAGGCNFPHVPAADGGKKVYYDALYTYSTEKDSSAWQKDAVWPFPIAYGATVEVEHGLVCMGGMNEQSSVSEAFHVLKDSVTGKIMIKPLPSLPEKIDNMAATRLDQTIYVTGGNQEKAGNALYALCLEKDTAWHKLADYPGPKRVQPVLLASDDALFLMGGFEVNAAEKKAVISSDYIVYDIQKNQWSEAKEVPAMEDGTPRALVGCSGVRVGNQFLIAGGVNYAIFKSALEGKAPQDYMKRPVDWYHFSKDLLVYDFKADSWKIVPDVDGFNKAGGSLLAHDQYIYMVCGETKPGIRTSEIIGYPLDALLNKKQQGN